MAKLPLLAIGEAMAELRRDASGGFSVSFAGDTYNTAVYFTRAYGEAAGFYTRVGEDPLSTEFLAVAADEQLSAEYISRDATHQIGIYAVSTDLNGERSFAYWRDQSAARQMFHSSESWVSLPDAEITYLSGITLAIMAPGARRRLIDALRARAKTGLVAFDSNFRPALWESKSAAQDVMAEMWEIAEIAFPSIDDEMDLFGDKNEADVVERFAQRQWHACAIKRGDRGPIMPGAPELAYPKAEKVVDTTSAGDSFNGGFLAAFLNGKDVEDCLMAGHRTAMQVVGFPGAIAPKGAVEF